MNQEIELVKIAASQSPAVYELMMSCLDYFSHWQKQQPSIEEVEHDLFYDLPPDTDLADKEVFAVMKVGQLVGLIDLLHDYPQEETTILGLMVFHPVVRHQGLGTFCYQQVENRCREKGQSKLRLGVYQSNGIGQKMWQKQGFIEVSQQDSPQGRLLVMEKELL
ncbi:GNAT family N-acetyltransferase [Enterococcus diestrammenae]|uniref:GNAT family N-acetyltransferase n=1 Tax=Enterococcus diestrammenae TaxID=1155073 RepID=UPI0019562EEA